uniref:pre-mRNA cleavage complex 2 protein Pcf11 n=1 Tax=Monopterus albus TaxID=43700 RepID=UPI0009B38380|nr:pre-mRNA cleavage complex 2 protein Pcf11 [Monopterus albus]
MDCLLINGYGIEKAGVRFHGSLCLKMDDKAAREDACREYQSSLEDLTFNSKPHINMLTILAEENLNFAKDIVAIIEAQISKAPPAEKLPVLYLVDSIVKNVGGQYLEVFAKNLITSFICVFEKVDENTRKSLFKLRSTWDDVFPLKKLYALDVRVNSLDPAWPIKPLPHTVNASIHVNPKFLKQSEDVSSPQPVITQAPPATTAHQPTPAISPSSVTQEQLIRQQLLAKQKQLLELQQKKIELELEQTKAQLAGGFVLPTSTPAAPSTASKPVSQTAPVVRSWISPSQTQTDNKPTLRLTPSGPPAAPQPKEQPAGKKDAPPTTGSPTLTPEKRLPEKPTRLEKARTPKKEVSEEKPKSKSLSPMAKSIQSKTKQTECEAQKSADGTKKDPRLKKRTQDKTGEAKDDEMKEKKRCSNKKDREEAARGIEPQRFSKGKLVNGSVTKHDREESTEKIEFKAGGNARTHARKRTRSRSRSRSPTTSPKRKERRSPKSRTRSSSLSPSPSHKPFKPRRVRTDEPQHVKQGREDRLAPKKNQSESRRSKRPGEDRHCESRDSHSPRSHDGGSKENKETPHRWRSGWEDNKHLKLSEDVKPGPQRHKPYGTPTRPTTPRTTKHRLSVDANLQIPDVLNSASKKDLLRRASKRLESGEISQEEFLNMAHQIKHFFQYQEEKQQHSESWDDSADFSAKKQTLMATPPSPLPRPHDTMDAAELSYYEHKSKLRKTQVTHRVVEDEWEGRESPEDGEEGGQGDKVTGGRSAPRKYSRMPRDRPGERQSEEPRPPPGPMIEEYNHGKEFPPLKSLQGLRFRRRVDTRESKRSEVRFWSCGVSGSRTVTLQQGEREWNSPLTERQREEQKSGYDAPRRYALHPDPRRPEGPPLPGSMGFQQQRPVLFEGPHNQMGPMRFDGPGHFEGPGQQGPRFDIPVVPPRFQGPPGQQGPPRFPQHNLQPPMRQMAPPVYENPMGPQQNFNMAPQRFPDPMNPQFPAGPMTFPAQPNLQQGGNFNMQPAPAPFYNPAPPTVGMQQPVNMIGNVNQPFLPQNPVPFRPPAQQVPPENHFGQVDVNDLLSKLISTGIIKPSQPDAALSTSSESSSTTPAPPPVVEEEEEEEQEQEVEVEEEEDDVPDLTSFAIDDMKQRYESIVTKLYSGNQCCLCSMRFTTAQTDMYADHLDWHFRQNHAGKVASKKVTHRRWYYSLTDWIEFEEIADLEERAKSQFFEKENEEEVQKSQAAAKEREFQSHCGQQNVSVCERSQAGHGVFVCFLLQSCEICQEPFETYWVEEEEDWFLKNAIRVDDKNFHPSCFEDYKNTSSYLDITPSPNKVLAEHPLSAFVKTEEESTSCNMASSLDKEEAECEGGEHPEVKTEEEQQVEPDQVKSEEDKL